ncbi:amino acid ABC transporter substrate-binding protein [Enterococcus faecalis]|uniref:amino acid ABC transporter substrate-binding protein n=1 Tax=Enterococcus faecalis TaxID=1351 RepID=UPI001376F3DB|nr:amino acid ABC transporter substrate-binding protein [Enterococcus faecalis]
MMKKKYSLALLVICCSLLLFAGCGKRKSNEDQWTRINEEKRIIIGLDDSFVPMGFQDKSGKIVGFDVDLAKAVFKLYGISVDFQPIDWSMKETELQNQTIDLIWNGYTKTSERAEKVQFTQPYMTNDQVLVSLKEKNIATASDMQGKILGVQNGSSGYDGFESQPDVLKKFVKDQTPILYDGFNEAFLDLKSGRIDGLLIDRVYANYYLSHEDNLKNYTISHVGYDNEDFAVGVRKSDNQLVQKINTAFETLRKDGTFSKISQKWFGEDVTNNTKIN